MDQILNYRYRVVIFLYAILKHKKHYICEYIYNAFKNDDNLQVTFYVNQCALDLMFKNRWLF